MSLAFKLLDICLISLLNHLRFHRRSHVTTGRKWRLNKSRFGCLIMNVFQKRKGTFTYNNLWETKFITACHAMWWIKHHSKYISNTCVYRKALWDIRKLTFNQRTFWFSLPNENSLYKSITENYKSHERRARVQLRGWSRGSLQWLTSRDVKK